MFLPLGRGKKKKKTHKIKKPKSAAKMAHFMRYVKSVAFLVGKSLREAI